MSFKDGKVNKENTAFFRFKKNGNKYLLTNQVGSFVFLSEEKFNQYLDGSLDKNSDVYRELKNKNFINEKIDLTALVNRYKTKNDFLLSGPILHIIVTTLRCNQNCIYCHASAKDMEAKEVDMKKETADKVLEIIFKTPNPNVVIEFQGGEPLVNWSLVQYVAKQAQIKAKELNKKLELRLVTNMNEMDEDKLNFLIENKISICTSLDGPKEIHDKNRPSKTKNKNHENISKWIEVFNLKYPKIKEDGYIWKISGVSVVSRYSLNNPKEIIDEYIKFGLESVFFRPLNPFGMSVDIWDKINYSSDEFLDFYKKALDYIIEKNKEGVFFVERLAKIFLEKILTDYDPNMMELRSPCGAGIGQLAYNYNGDVYSCDEGRMMSMMGDYNFKLGDVFNNEYKDLVTSPVIRTLCTASCLEGLPGCSDCAYLPYCGTCPIYNYATEGNIFSQMPNNDRCKINKGILDYLFEKLQDEEISKIFKSWL